MLFPEEDGKPVDSFFAVIPFLHTFHRHLRTASLAIILSRSKWRLSAEYRITSEQNIS